MRSSMKSKDGEHTCEMCSGKGCWHCDRTGVVIQCPVCGNTVPEMTPKKDNNRWCQMCGCVYSKSGQILEVNQ